MSMSAPTAPAGVPTNAKADDAPALTTVPSRLPIVLVPNEREVAREATLSSKAPLSAWPLRGEGQVQHGLAHLPSGPDPGAPDPARTRLDGSEAGKTEVSGLDALHAHGLAINKAAPVDAGCPVGSVPPHPLGGLPARRCGSASVQGKKKGMELGSWIPPSTRRDRQNPSSEPDGAAVRTTRSNRGQNVVGPSAGLLSPGAGTRRTRPAARPTPRPAWPSA